MADEQDIQFNYRFSGTAELQVSVEVEGTDPDDAESYIDMCDVAPDGDGISCDYCVVSRFEREDIEDLGVVDEDEELDESEEPTRKYRVDGVLSVEVHIILPGESMGEAAEDLTTLDWTLDDKLTVLSLEVNSFEQDDSDDENGICMQEKVWDDHMSKMERMQFLLGLGCSDDAAHCTAGFEGYNVREEWLCQVDWKKVQV